MLSQFLSILWKSAKCDGDGKSLVVKEELASSLFLDGRCIIRISLRAENVQKKI
jgi:hypothetical protein